MKSGAREVESTVGADGGSNPETFAVRPDAALDVGQIFLEGTDGDSEFVAEVIKHPLPIAEALDDLLSTGECRAHGSVVGTGAGGDSAPPSASHSRTVRPST